MMTLPEVLALLILATLGWLFWNSLKVREIANAAMREACKAEGVLFLDDTVALESLWPERNEEGQLHLRRIYVFKYSDTGHERRKGNITVRGDKVSAVNIGLSSVGETLH